MNYIQLHKQDGWATERVHRLRQSTKYYTSLKMTDTLAELVGTAQADCVARSPMLTAALLGGGSHMSNGLCALLGIRGHAQSHRNYVHLRREQRAPDRRRDQRVPATAPSYARHAGADLGTQLRLHVAIITGLDLPDDTAMGAVCSSLDTTVHKWFKGAISSRAGSGLRRHSARLRRMAQRIALHSTCELLGTILMVLTAAFVPHAS